MKIICVDHGSVYQSMLPFHFFSTRRVNLHKVFDVDTWVSNTVPSMNGTSSTQTTNCNADPEGECVNGYAQSLLLLLLLLLLITQARLCFCINGSDITDVGLYLEMFISDF